MYFRFNYVAVFACISVTIIVSVNGVDVFPLTGISVTVIVNGKNTECVIWSVVERLPLRLSSSSNRTIGWYSAPVSRRTQRSSAVHRQSRAQQY